MTPHPARSFCYVLTDPNVGRYAAMTAVSAAATREFHPDERINVVCDAVTADRLTATNHLLLRYVDAVIPVDVPYDEVKLQSRYLKTTLRSHVSGDFVFIDADAVPMRSLKHLFAWDGEFCIAFNNSAPTAELSVRPENRIVQRQMNWPEPTMYFNSGLFLARDVPAVHTLFRQWHEHWLQFIASGDLHKDQQPLNAVIMTCGVKLGILPAGYNAQILAREDSIRGAHVVHFYLSVNKMSDFIFEDFVEHAMTRGEVDMAGLRAFFRSRYPWKSRDSMRRFYWTGHPVLAAGVAVRKAFARLGQRSSGKPA